MARAALAGATLLALAWGRPAAAQESLFERLALDRLQLSELGVSFGMVRPTQILRTESYAVHADYGEIAPRWRVVFTATYWGSRYTDAAVRAFMDTVRQATGAPPPAPGEPAGRILVSDVALGGDVLWSRRPGGIVRPYVGGGVSAHVVNVEGRPISGTFVERALDNITAGIAGLAGVNVTLLTHIVAGAQVRYDLLSGFRYGSLRLMGSYRFDAVPGRARP